MLSVRKNVVQPPALLADRGAMLTVYAGGGCGYAATSDLSLASLQSALDRAAGWARAGARRLLIDFRALARPAPSGSYASPDADAAGYSRRDWHDLLGEESRQAGCDPRIVDWEATVETRVAEHRFLTSAGGDVTQRYRFVMPNMSVNPCRRRYPDAHAQRLSRSGATG